MTRTTNNIPIGDGKIRARVRIEGDGCLLDTVEYRFAQFQMLEMISQQMELVHCALNTFQKLNMFHDGTRWVVECEAIVESPASLGL